MKHLPSPRNLLLPLTALAAPFVLAACLFGNDEEDKPSTTPVEQTLKGRLADLDSLAFQPADSTSDTGYYRWYLPLNTFEAPDNRKNCVYTAYLGSADTAAYTNHRMSQVSRHADSLRSQGVFLYRAQNEPAHTHYRVDLYCTAFSN